MNSLLFHVPGLRRSGSRLVPVGDRPVACGGIRPQNAKGLALALYGPSCGKRQ